jgi:acyl-CoA thioesterase-1
MVRNLSAFISRLEIGSRVRIAGLGDSLTYGWMVERGFFDRFVDGLAQRFPRASIERQNHGIPGDTSEGGLARLSEVLAWQPDVVIIEFGLNDCFLSVPPAEVGRLQSVIAQDVEKAHSQPILCTSCPLLEPSERKVVEPYYQAIRDAAEKVGAPLADLDLGWRDSSPVVAELFLEDGIHPSDLGHEIMSKVLLGLF